jgi:23S rRNA (uracil1939-C5)-methyltransferase
MQLRVEKLVFEGYGLARAADGRVWFIEGALPDETVEVEPVRLAKRHGFARLLNILTPSPDRRTPPCPVFGSCGGCQILNLAPEAQARAKEGFVRDALRRLPGALEVIQPLWASEQTTHFRNRMSFAILPTPEGPRVGLHERGAHDRGVPADACVLPHPGILDVVHAAQAHLREHPAATDPRPVRLDVRDSARTGRRMARLVMGGPGVPDALCAAIAPLCTTVVVTDARGRHRTWSGDGGMEERLDRFMFRIGPDDFFQTHTAQAERLFRAIRDEAARAPVARAWDLYAGVGVIACFLADAAREVWALESDAGATRAAENLRRHGLAHARAARGDAARLPTGAGAPDLVAVDPPRAGLSREACAALLRLAPPRLFYISCHPATLARDLERLTAGGYVIEFLQPLDMFPHSFHVETWAVLRKLGGTGLGARR